MYRSGIWRLAGIAARVLVTVVALSLLGSVLRPLLLATAGVALAVLAGALFLTVRLLRYRRW